MSNPRRDYFDIIFSVVITSFTVILLVGQMAYISIGLTVGIADWGLEGVLVIGLGIFGPMIVGGMALTLFAAWKYWRVDDDGIANGNLFHETKLMFKEIESLEVKIVVIGAKPFVTAQEELCFKKGKKMVMIPAFQLSETEKEWLRQQIRNDNN